MSRVNDWLFATTKRQVVIALNLKYNAASKKWTVAKKSQDALRMRLKHDVLPHCKPKYNVQTKQSGMPKYAYNLQFLEKSFHNMMAMPFQYWLAEYRARRKKRVKLTFRVYFYGVTVYVILYNAYYSHSEELIDIVPLDTDEYPVYDKFDAAASSAMQAAKSKFTRQPLMLAAHAHQHAATSAATLTGSNPLARILAQQQADAAAKASWSQYIASQLSKASAYFQ